MDAYSKPGADNPITHTHTDTQSRALRVPEVMPTSAAERQEQLASLKQLLAWWTAERVGRAEDARVRTLQQLACVGQTHVGRDSTHEPAPALLQARRLEALHPDPSMDRLVVYPLEGRVVRAD